MTPLRSPLRAITATLTLACGLAVAAPVVHAQQAAGGDKAKATDQTAKASEAAKDGDETTTVVVKGKTKDTNRVDRQVYDVSKNADAQTGTAGDALNKVPGVTVDPSGNVTLRGRAVQIYLNGRPSLMLSGDNRAIALQSMPSAYLSSIEVISNPGSQYASGSSDPIINIVTKRKMPPGMFGAVTIRRDSPGGGQASVYASATYDKLNVTGFGVQYSSRTVGKSSSDLQAFDPATGALTSRTQSHGTSLSHNQGAFDSLSGEYDFDLNNVLNVGGTYSKGQGDWGGPGQATTYGPAGAVTGLSGWDGHGTYVYQSQGLTFAYTHYGRKPDETLKIDGSLSESKNLGQSRNQVTYALSTIPGNTGTQVDTKSKVSDIRSNTVSADYNTPIGNDQLAIGAQINRDDSYARTTAFGPDNLGATPTPQPLFSDDFRYRQTVGAIYGTYQRELTDALTVLGGMRVESFDLATDDAGAQLRNHIVYTRYNPSVFATYVLSPARKLRFNYVHHQHRADAVDFNPHLIYNSRNAVTLGNPRLRPQENDSFEGAYEYQDKAVSYALRGFFRRDDHLITSTSRFIPDPQGLGNQVLQTTRVNFGHQTADGLTGTYNNRVNDNLTLSADATVTFSATYNPNIVGAQQGTSVGGSASINYTFANKDQVFVSDKMTGKSFTGQGYSTAYSVMTLQYKHALTPKVNMTVSITDPLRTSKTMNVTSTPLIHAVSVSSPVAPTFYVGITRNFSYYPQAETGK